MRNKNRNVVSQPHESSILHQVKSLQKSWIATTVGAILGGMVPVIVYDVAHRQVLTNKWLWFIVAGGLLFSATNVFKWSHLASKNYLIATGFTVLMEAALTFTQGFTSKSALGVLIGVNAIAYAHSIVVGGQSVRVRSLPKKKAVVRKEKTLTSSVKAVSLTETVRQTEEDLYNQIKEVNATS